MKKVVMVLLVGILVFGLVGCNKRGISKKPEDTLRILEEMNAKIYIHDGESMVTFYIEGTLFAVEYAEKLDVKFLFVSIYEKTSEEEVYSYSIFNDAGDEEVEFYGSSCVYTVKGVTHRYECEGEELLFIKEKLTEFEDALNMKGLSFDVLYEFGAWYLERNS